MKTKDATAAVHKGETLCKGFTGDSIMYWLHPSLLAVPADTAEAIIKLRDITPGGDGLFGDASQTWTPSRQEGNPHE